MLSVLSSGISGACLGESLRQWKKRTWKIKVLIGNNDMCKYFNPRRFQAVDLVNSIVLYHNQTSNDFLFVPMIICIGDKWWSLTFELSLWHWHALYQIYGSTPTQQWRNTSRNPRQNIPESVWCLVTVDEPTSLSTKVHSLCWASLLVCFLCWDKCEMTHSSL